MGNDWYYAREGEQAGPVSATELKRLASSGRLRPADLIWQEGMKEWTAARLVKGLFEGVAVVMPAAPPVVATASMAEVVPVAASSVRRFAFDHMLEMARRSFGEPFIRSTGWLFSFVGHWGLTAALTAGLFWSIALAVTFERIGLLGVGLILLAAMAVLQYWAQRLLPVLPQSQPGLGRLVSPGPLECIAVLAATGGLLALVSMTIAAMDQGAWLLILPGMAAFILCQYTAILALNPRALGVTLAAEVSSAEEVLGLLSWVARASLHLAPVAFGVGAAWAFVTLAYACLVVMAPSLAWHGSQPLSGLHLVAVLPVCLLLAPAWAYAVYLGCGLLAELLSAMLVVPSKLDALGKHHAPADDA